MNRYDYTIRCIRILKQIEKKIKKIKARSGTSRRAIEKKEIDLNFAYMHKEMERERIQYALGLIDLGSLRPYYRPTGIQTYQGLRDELEALEFDEL